MDPNDIKDEDSLKAWLGDKPRNVQVAVMWRVAMRVAPIVFQDCPPVQTSSTRSLLEHLRALITTAVSAQFQSSKTISATYDAKFKRHRKGPAEHSVEAASRVIAEVVGGAAALTDPGRPADEFPLGYYGKAISLAEEVLGNALWSELSNDADLYAGNIDLFSTRLWRNDNPNQEVWEDVKASWRKNPEDWQFWIDWYEGALIGVAPNWDWGRAIVAEVDDQTWNGNAAAIQKEIKDCKPSQIGAGVLADAGQVRAEIRDAMTKMQDFRSSFDNDRMFYKDEVERVEQKFSVLEKDYETRITAAEEAVKETYGLKAPVKLWEAKAESHRIKMNWAFGVFCGGLCIMAALVVCLLVANFLGSSPITLSLSGTDIFYTAGFLTLSTLFLWFIRLKMKEYLAERHLMIEAQEKTAFAKTYLGLLSVGDTSEEAKEQRGIIYAALFRHGNDGMIKEEGSLDPSIAAALSKFLSK